VTEERPFKGARRLLRGCRYGALATLDHTGAPFATLVALATDAEGRPLLLLSELARHTANLRRDARASLLLDASEGTGERLAAPRLTLIGRIEPAGFEGSTRRYLARHPKSQALFQLADFSFWRMTPEAGHLVAGFGRIDAIAAGDLLVPQSVAEALAAVEPDAIAHMHADHADALALLGGAPETMLAAIDADGLDLVAEGIAVRRDFAGRLADAGRLRQAVVGLVRNLRKS